MPNWTYNTIIVTGDKEKVTKMLNDAVKHENGTMDFGSWFPVPETYNKYDTTNHPDGRGLELGKCYRDGLGNEGIVTEELLEEYKQATKEQAEKYGAVGWYDYNCKYFGCKWNCEVTADEPRDDGDNQVTLYLYCDTPWCAPEKFLRRMSERYPELVFADHAEYEEGFWETIEYCAGEADKVEEGEYQFDEDEE